MHGKAVAIFSIAVLATCFCGCKSKPGIQEATPVEKGESAVEYYASQGVMTEPGKYVGLYDSLPDSVPDLVAVVQGVLVHAGHTWRYGVTLSKDQDPMKDSPRRVEEILRRIAQMDDRPIASPRAPGKRLPVVCRHFALLTCSILRHKGYSARVRAGFATYFPSGVNENHWICEYWNRDEKRWVQVDPQLDETIRTGLKITFNPLDLPKGKFLTAGQAWKLCRQGKADPYHFGLNSKFAGIGMVKGLAVHDLLTLNKFELLPWEGTGKDPSDEVVDRLAELTELPELHLQELKGLYAKHAEFHMPANWQP